jgi:hypothetical protein
MAPALFALVILEIGSCFLPRVTWTAVFLFYASCCSWDDGCVPLYPVFFSVEMGVSQTLLPVLAWNCDPSPLSLPCSLGWQAHSTGPRYWLRWVAAGWGLANYFLRNGLCPFDPPDLSLQVARITGLSHRQPPKRFFFFTFLSSWGKNQEEK